MLASLGSLYTVESLQAEFCFNIPVTQILVYNHLLTVAGGQK